MEVLAPAGSREALEAAVFAGADAVYLAGKAFGARAAAQNFTDEELREAMVFCRARNVRVYVTVNTLIKDTEMDDALAFVRFLCEIAADGIIVQDLGLFQAIRQCAPALPVHVSTQMSLHSRAGVRLLQENGAKRVVLARELSLAEIREITESCDVETECFVHGALCVSVSGQCYFSAMLGSRSGNRGMCAQPCRLPFLADGGNGHALSLKDLSFIDEMDRLAGAGVTSAKIEGRMKRPEYVAAAVSACRKAADGAAVPPQLREQLAGVFSRSGFTKGYLDGKIDETMLGIRTKQDVTAATDKIMGQLRSLYRRECARVPVSFTVSADKDTVTLTAADDRGNHSEQQAPCEAVPPLSPERCRQQLAKTGGTPFFTQDIIVPETGLSIPVSALNNMRREVLITLLKLREFAPGYEFLYNLSSSGKNKKSEASPQMRLIASYQTLSQVTEEAASLAYVMLPLFSEEQAIRQLPIRPEQIILEIPRAVFGLAFEDLVREKMRAHMQRGRRIFWCGNPGALQLCHDLGAIPFGGYSLNVLNTRSLLFLREQGTCAAELSPELSAKEIAALGTELPKAVTVYGRQAMMLTRKCPVKSRKHPCSGCGGQTEITDRQKKKFPVMCTGAGKNKYTQVFNSVPLWMADKLADLPAVDFGILRFTVENAVECAEVLSAFNRQEKPDSDYTRGLFYRGIH